MLMEALGKYDVDNDVFNGDPDFGDQWAVLFDTAKANYTQKCLACHGCSGNGQGSIRPPRRHPTRQST